MLHLASADLVDRAGVIDDQGGKTQWLVDVHADNTSEHVQDLRSSDPLGIDLPGNAPSGSLDLPGAIKSGAVPTEGNGTTLKSITNLSQISPKVPALEQVGLADADAKSQLAPYQMYELPTESLHLVDRYYQHTEKFFQNDGSTFRMDVVAFLTVCHAGLLQKFALPGMPDWMAAMNAVCFMLRTIDVPADELMWSPMSSKFAAAFALTTLVCVSIRGGLEKEKVCSLVLDHVDKIILFVTTYRVPKAMSKKSVRQTMLWTIYWSHAAVKRQILDLATKTIARREALTYQKWIARQRAAAF